jgi:hypothetical protein
VIRRGCWPLSAYSTWFLFHLAAAGKHLQERSALALLGQLFERYSESVVSDDGNWLLSPVDFWSADLQHELISSEEGGQQGAITHAYASVDAKHGASLQEDLKRLLRAVVLASKLGLQASNRDDAALALSELAGISDGEAKAGLRLLQDEYNVIEWDEAFKQFDILSDAVPRTQFLLFIRQRVASAYDERGKAALFASKASGWCDLLSDLECDFAEENKITTREWRYQGVTSNLENFPMHVKLASDRWGQAIAVDDPRGTVIYCYLERDRDSTVVGRDLARLLKNAAREKGMPALPILSVLLHDEDGSLGQALAELAVLQDSLSEEDRLKFGNLIPAHTEKQRQVVRSQIETMVKGRKYVTGLNEELEAQRLSRAGTELFSRIYKSPLTFPFDGFSTARGNAADSCQELTRELLLGTLDYDAVMGKPVKVKNRAVTVLKESWGIFAKNGNVMTRPSHPVLRNVTTKWDELLATGERRLPIEQTLRQLCSAPHGANVASAALLLGVFVAPRSEKLVVARDGQQFAISQWVQNGLFRGKFLDLGGLNSVDLVMLGEESSEWEVLLDEWEQAQSYLTRIDCFKRAGTLKQRIPVPPALGYRELHLEELSRTAANAVSEMEAKQNDGFTKMESGHQRDNVALVAWGAAILHDLSERMKVERPLWDEHQVNALQPHIERAKQEITQYFKEWLSHQSPRIDTPEAVGDFKHKMLRLLGGNLRKLGLDRLVEELEQKVGQLIRNAETAAEARQLVRDVRSWLLTHRDSLRVVRVADGRALLDVGKEYTAKLQGMSQRIQMQELGEVRTNLSQFLGQLKDAVEQIVKRAERLWNLRLRSIEDLDSCVQEVESLLTAFENSSSDLSDLLLMKRALRTYHEDFKQLSDERLTWPEFESLSEKLRIEAQQVINDDDVPWPPSEVVSAFEETISKRRKEVSITWIDAIEADVAAVSSLSAADANRLYARAGAPPATLTESHAKRLKRVIKKIEGRLDVLKIDWLVEKFKELSPSLQKKFLRIVDDL